MGGRALRRTEVDPYLEVTYEQCRSEAPEYLLVFAIMTLLGTIPIVFLDQVLGPAYALGNLVTLAAFTVSGWLIWRRTVAARWAPPLTAASMVVAVGVISSQIGMIGEAGFAGVLLVAATYGAVVLTWPSFLIAGAAMLVVAAPAALSFRATNDSDWLAVLFAALLVSATLVWVRRRAVRRLAAANQTIERLASHDALTGLLNRRGLDAALPLLTAVARRDRSPLHGVFVDISALKRANDDHGHLVGDLVIARVGQAVSSVSRESDLVCRWGGDEFLLVGLGDQPDPLELRARIVAAIDMDGLDGKWVPDVGVGTSARDDDDLDALVHEADAAMYRGRGLR